MDDLQEKLNQILSDPEALEQVKGLGQMLGLNNNNKDSAKEVSVPAVPPPKPQNDGLFGNLMNSDTLGTITKLMPMLSMLKKDDESTLLLESLRPFLSKERCAKLDQAKKMLQLIKILPLIKNIGIL